MSQDDFKEHIHYDRDSDSVVVEPSGGDDTEAIAAAFNVARNLGCPTVRLAAAEDTGKP